MTEIQSLNSLLSYFVARRKISLSLEYSSLRKWLLFYQKEAEHCFGVILRPLFETGPLRIKKELIACCAIVGKHVSEHFFSNDIVKHFLAERCKEPVMGVRKMCAEVMPHLVELTIT
jgi:hypothetical protein